MCSDPSQLCVEAISAVFGIGFAFPLAAYCIGLTVGMALSAVRKL